MENTQQTQPQPKVETQSRQEVTIKSLLETGAHFGTNTAMWNPKMAPFIFGIRRGKGAGNHIYIINLESTIKMWKKARQAIVDNICNGGELLFVSTKSNLKELVSVEASSVSSPYVDIKWLGGTLTNLDIIKKEVKRLDRLEDMLKRIESPTCELNLKKKEIVVMQKEVAKLVKSLNGIRKLKKPPTMLFITDVHKNKLALAEAKRLKIPVVALVDTNVDPTTIDFPIPANDDSNSSQALFLRCVADAVAEGQAILRSRKEADIQAEELKAGPPVEDTTVVKSEIQLKDLEGLLNPKQDRNIKVSRKKAKA